MTLHDLMQALTATNLYPIPVEGDIDYESVQGLSFIGDLEAFIQAAKALNARCVFVTSRTLEGMDFLYQAVEVTGGPQHYAAVRRRDLHDAQPAIEGLELQMWRHTTAGRRDIQTDLGSVVDLREVEPSLNEFKERLGSECGYRLTVHSPTEWLEYILHLEWWKRFSKLRDGAIEKILQERALAESKQNEKEEKRSGQILNALRLLINDPDFVRLPTQRAMQAYALERIADLDIIHPNTLKTEIQSLDAKIKARGLGRKK